MRADPLLVESWSAHVLTGKLISPLLVAVILTGCAGQEAADEAEVEVRWGDAATYEARVEGAGSNPLSMRVSVHIGAAPERLDWPGGGSTEVVRIAFRVESEKETFAFGGAYSLRDGSALSIGALEGGEEGGRQFAASSRLWYGHPDGPFQLERILGGITIPTILSAAGGPTSLGTLASVLSNGTVVADGVPVGRIERAPALGWPQSFTWTTDDRRLSLGQVDLVRASEEPLAPREPAVEAPPERAYASFTGRIPDTGELPVAFSLEEADGAARRHPTSELYFSRWPAAWLTYAEYQGPLADAQGETPESWTLIYADGDERAGFLVRRPSPLLPLVAEPLADPPGPTPTRSVLPRDLVIPASIPMALKPGDIVRIDWSSARSPPEHGTDDAATWQFGWMDASGWHNVLFSGVTGDALAEVKAPRRIV